MHISRIFVYENEIGLKVTWLFEHPNRRCQFSFDRFRLMVRCREEEIPL